MKGIVSSLDNLSLSGILQSPQENLKLLVRLPADAAFDFVNRGLSTDREQKTEE